jgi:PadR family transcriptional regulator, regulatory protein PadR
VILCYSRIHLWFELKGSSASAIQGHVEDKDLYSGLIRLHVLHHACGGEVFGLDIIEELARHGYKMSPGTMYPILHGLEKRGYVKSTEFRSGKVRRRLYRATPAGRKALKAARQKVRDLFGELIEGK